MCRALSIVFGTLSKFNKLGLFVRINTCYVLCTTVLDPGSEKLMNETDFKEFANLITGEQQMQKREQRVLQRLLLWNGVTEEGGRVV